MKEDIKASNETSEMSGTLLNYFNVDFKFLTTVILLICTIGAVVVYFPRVSSCQRITTSRKEGYLLTVTFLKIRTFKIITMTVLKWNCIDIFLAVMQL